MITREIPATFKWPNNAYLFYDASKLGYLDGKVLDATYGEGGFWNLWTPKDLVTNDLYTPAQVRSDFRDLPFPDDTFDSVVFDPPYKLSGTPALGQFDIRYGIDKGMTVSDRMALILSGARECVRVSKRYTLIKCQDQVVSGHVRWQTFELQNFLYGCARLEDRFDFITTPQPQPGDRRQVHARRNTSQLLVFEKR